MKQPAGLRRQQQRVRTIIHSIAHSPKPWRRFWGLVLKRTHLAPLFTIPCDGFVLRFYPTALSATLWVDPQDRSGDQTFLRRYLRPGDVMIDVGANIGHLTLTALQVVGAAGHVYAIEPHPRIYRYLCGNLALNQMTANRVTTFNVALGGEQGVVTFADTASDDANHVKAQGAGLTVPLQRLEQLPIGHETIALLKIDVEGFEKFVLEGAATRLPQVACIYFEYAEDHYQAYGYSGPALLTSIQESGFHLLRIVDQATVSPVAPTYRTTQDENLVAVRNQEDFCQRTGFRLASARPSQTTLGA